MSSSPLLVSTCLTSPSKRSTLLGFGVFQFTFFNLSVEIAHLIVTHLIDKCCVKTGNARFGEGFARASMDRGPVLQTAGFYLRSHTELNSSP